MTRRVPTPLKSGSAGRRRLLRAAALAALTVCCAFAAPQSAEAGGKGQPTDWNRFYHYPYTYYPRNFEAPQEFDSLYYKYPIERRIPVYRTDWHNFYPRDRPYHSGHHFLLDVF